MVQTSSTMLQLGSLMPFFDLPILQTSINLDNSSFSFKDRLNQNMLSDKPVLLMFLCAHCPFVKHIEGQLSKLDDDFGKRIHLIAIASNCMETHSQDGPEYLAKQKLENGWKFPYLLDIEQTLAKALKAACTPDFFLFASSSMDSVQRLMYRGQLDNSRPNNTLPTTGSDLRAALSAILNFRKVSTDQKPSIGCNIKWQPGFEPIWFG